MSDLTLRDRLLAADALRREAFRLALGEAEDLEDISADDLDAAAAERRAAADRLVRGYGQMGLAFQLIELFGGFPAAGTEPSNAAFGGSEGWLLIDHENGTYSIERDDNDPAPGIHHDADAFQFVLNKAVDSMTGDSRKLDLAAIEALRFHCRDVVAVAAYI